MATLQDLQDWKLLDDNGLLFYHQTIKALLANKVNKETGKSLLSDSEIERLKTLVNYDDTTINSDIAELKQKIQELETSTYDDTELRNLITTTASTTLSSANSYTDTEVTKVKNSMTSAMHYKGSVDNYTDLPANAAEGDCYNIVNASEHNKAGDNAVRTKDGQWDVVSGVIDTSEFLTASDIVVMSNEDIQKIFEL